MTVDYSVYLVTDSTPAILGDKDLISVVEASLRGGVTVVQYRDKHSAKEDVVAVAKKLHQLTQSHGVPLLINDRVDVAVEIGCEGVHIGQDDMGDKKDTKSIIGPSGVADILAALDAAGHSSMPAVCIGGVNASNASAVLTGSASPHKALDGLAVVSAIIAAADPVAASRDLLGKVITAKIPDVLAAVARKTPLSHNMTNLVVQNFAANVALCVGASPIMSNYAEEAADLARLGGALVLNMGTVTPEGLNNYAQALKAYNQARRPVVLDPVGAGATSVRREAVQTLIASGTFAVIKGNQSEIQTVHGASVTQRGVDSSSSLTVPQRARLVRSLARQRRCVVLLTGPTDLISDGRRTLRVDNGHGYLGMVTGTGCTLGTTVSAMVAAYEQDALVATVAGTVMFGLAAEMAAQRDHVRGPGSFVPAFLDELFGIRKATMQGDSTWLALAKVAAVDVADDE
ncbi:putative thiamine biosynthetic bifunctional enzyme [Metarhizium anisopliae]